MDDSIEEVIDLFRRDERRDSMWLALTPLAVALVFGLLLVPRRCPPEGMPLPVADARQIAHVVRADHELAEQGRREPLSGAVRALGSAVRQFHGLEARDADARAMGEARRAIDVALADAIPGGMGGLLRLRAVQLEAFLEEVRLFAETGVQSDELHALAGAFVRSMTNEGWCEGHTFAPTPSVLRVMFKQMWNAFLGLENNHELEPSLDEQRVLYAFYLSHPHPSKASRQAIAAARRGARDAKACRAVAEAERTAIESWRLERIIRLSAIDPAYPADYARGVASFRRGDYGAAADAFRAWLGAHAEGPLALRAQNYLRAAVDANRAE
jgi:hypothetical protein